MPMSMAEDPHSQDRKELDRGVLVNFVGYALKLANPAVLILATRLYGAESWGVFVTAQATLLVLVRVVIMGLDKGMLWWIPRQSSGTARCGGLVLGGRLAAGAVAASLLMAFGGIDLACRLEVSCPDVPQLRLLVLSLCPILLTEFFLHATMGKRRMEGQVLIRETLAPLLFTGGAVGAWHLGFPRWGLGGAYLVANIVASLAAFRLFLHLFPKEEGAEAPDLGGLLRYSMPLWANEFTNSLLLRLDTLAIASFCDAKAVGVYGIVLQFSNAVRSIRRSYDPIVVAISSRISASGDMSRLEASFSRATSLVITTQTPVFVGLAVLLKWLLPLYGPDFGSGEIAIVTICAFWIVTAPLQLCSLVVTGFGRSGMVLLNTLLVLAIEAPLLWLLVPRWGLEGASLAVGISYLLVSGIQAFQMRRVTGGWNYDGSVVVTLLWTVGGLAVFATVLLLAGGWESTPARLAALAAYAAFLFAQVRTTRLFAR